MSRIRRGARPRLPWAAHPPDTRRSRRCEPATTRRASAGRRAPGALRRVSCVYDLTVRLRPSSGKLTLPSGRARVMERARPAPPKSVGP
ncbi:hypothetical protein ACFPRL_21015 [Pseudoclavibacter helvolus]